MPCEGLEGFGSTEERELFQLRNTVPPLSASCSSRQRFAFGILPIPGHPRGDSPVVAATDYVCAYPDLIARFVAAPYVSLGTDGFGRSDNRAALRRFFEVDRQHVAVAALHALAETGGVEHGTVETALAKYGITADLAAPWLR